jgi:hypothetical protein
MEIRLSDTRNVPKKVNLTVWSQPGEICLFNNNQYSTHPELFVQIYQGVYWEIIVKKGTVFFRERDQIQVLK